VIGATALLVCFAFSTGLAWIAGGKIAPLYRGRFALGVGIGESFGAVLAANYIAHYPGNVKKCILVSPGELYARKWENKHRGWPRDRVSQEKLQMMKSALLPYFFRFAFG
jgi:hypothetical protein